MAVCMCWGADPVQWLILCLFLVHSLDLFLHQSLRRKVSREPLRNCFLCPRGNTTPLFVAFSHFVSTTVLPQNQFVYYHFSCQSQKGCQPNTVISSTAGFLFLNHSQEAVPSISKYCGDDNVCLAILRNPRMFPYKVTQVKCLQDSQNFQHSSAMF